ncbi:MAG: hypothetical protein NTY20_00735 [Candidatus Aenigmarchaeota archaeon]|nr:hypothetical protein [Candidatus Aenigmarchaeota archaeon]
MKLFFLGFVLSLVLLTGTAHALRLTDGLFFTVAPNSTGEVYFILPDDVGAGPGKADYFITTMTNWPVDLTEQTVTTEENNTAIIPIKFYSSGRKEGDCSNYTVTISAPGLNLSRTWKGGVCLSKYADVDISKSGGDAKSVLNNNVDLFSAGFRTYTKSAKPGETVQVEVLIQSQASLMIDVTLQSQAFLDKRSFVIQTSQNSEYKGLIVNASAASSGNYDIILIAKARNCSLTSCTKQSSMKLVVSGTESQEGFAVSVFPENLAIKKLEPVTYSFTLQNNYKDEVNFIVDVEKPLDLDSSFVLGNFTVPGLSERTENFTVTPHNSTGFYEIKVRASMNDVEKIISAYLSTNEMVSDVYRNADDVLAGANSSVRAVVDSNVRNWYSSYSKNEYGSNITGYANLQETLDAARKQNASSVQPKPPANNTYVPADGTESQPNPLQWIVIPIALGGAVLVVLMLFRRKKDKGEEFLELSR